MNKKVIHLWQKAKIKRQQKIVSRKDKLTLACSKKEYLKLKTAYILKDSRYLLAFMAFLLVFQPLMSTNIQFAKAAANPALALTGSIWENEDGSTPDTVTQITAADGTIEAPWGSRINLRAQLKNTGDALSGKDIGLFYDKGDGHWNKANNGTKKQTYGMLPELTTIDSSGDTGMRTDMVIDKDGIPWISYYTNDTKNIKVAKYVRTGGSGCASAEWTCTTIESAGDVGLNGSIAIDDDNNPWVTYYDNTNGNLELAQYVGSGGIGCDVATWTCTTIDSPNLVGNYSTIAFDATGKAWVVYYDATNFTIRVANHVGSGGNCSNTAWNCTALDSIGSVAVAYSSIAFDGSGKAWVSYKDEAVNRLTVAEYVGSGGSGCSSSAWTCAVVHNTTFSGGDSSMAIDQSGKPWISYSLGSDLGVSQYVGSGGNCLDTRWKCTSVETTNNVGTMTSIGFDKTGSAWVTYYDQTNKDLRVAKYVGSGGTGCASSEWKCTAVDNDFGESGFYTSIAFDNYGNALIAHYNNDSKDLNFIKMTDWQTGGGCDNNAFANAWNCSAIDTTSNVGRYTSMAIDHSGIPWVAYYYATGGDLRIAKYVATGGNCNGSTKWQCYSIKTTNDTGTDVSITFDNNDKPVVAFKDTTNNQLWVARYVGTGGTNCVDASWNCINLDNTAANVGTHPSIVVDASNTVWISYTNVTNTSLKVARSVASGGGGCTTGLTTWRCVTVDNTGTDYGFNSSIEINPVDGNPWVAYNGLTTNKDLKIAKYNGSGTGACGVNWTCSTIYSGNVGDDVSMAFAPNGIFWIAFNNTTSGTLLVAKDVGSGGTGCAAATWTCTTIDDQGQVGQSANMVFDPTGNAWVVYEQENAGVGDRMKIAKYVGSGGTGCGAAVYDWDCNYLDGESASLMGKSADIAIGVEGEIWVSYHDETGNDLRIAHLDRGGEILLTTAQLYNNGAGILESHADMTTTSDTANRDDADCIGGGTWNNGKYSSSTVNAGISLPIGSTTAQCTEVVFSIDLSQAEVGATYRFMFATSDNWQSDKSTWRGLSGTNKIPELTVTDVSMIIGKDNTRKLPNCRSNTDWGCEDIESITNGSLSIDMALSPDGTPWIAYFDVNATQDTINVAKYVGTGGTGCDVPSWTCEVVKNENVSNDYGISIQIDSKGNPWIVYSYDTAGHSRIAQYVGSGGAGCVNSTWECYTLASNGDAYTSMAIDKNDNVWVAMFDQGGQYLTVAHYVGSGGTGCLSGSVAWTCERIDDNTNFDTLGRQSSIAISPEGTPWIAAHAYVTPTLGNDTVNYIVAIEYVGSGGTGCSNKAWTCYNIKNMTDVYPVTAAITPSIAFDHSGVAHISFRESNNNPINMMLAKYVGTGGTGCNTTAWACTAINDNGQDSEAGTSSLAFDSDNNPMIAHLTRASAVNDADLGLTRYVGTGGTGCSGTTAYSCLLIDSANNIAVGFSLTLLIDKGGYGWISYINDTTDKISIAKSHFPVTKPSFDVNSEYNSRSAGNTMGRYMSTYGRTVADNPGKCTGTTDYYGACAYFHANGDYDTIVAQANEMPILNFSQKYDTNTDLPTAQWEGTTSLAPNTAGVTGDLYLQVYRYGSTNAWETVKSDTTSSNCSSASCKLEGVPSGTASQYFELKNGKYWVHFRIYQVQSTTASITFKTDQFKAATNDMRMRMGSFMQDGYRRPLNWR